MSWRFLILPLTVLIGGGALCFAAIVAMNYGIDFSLPVLRP